MATFALPSISKFTAHKNANPAASRTAHNTQSSTLQLGLGGISLDGISPSCHNAIMQKEIRQYAFEPQSLDLISRAARCLVTGSVRTT